MLTKANRFLTLTVSQQKGLSKILIIFAVCGVLIAKYIANYYYSENTPDSINSAWELFATIIISCFAVLLLAMRKDIILLIGECVYSIAFWLFVNNAIERAQGIKGWSWWDFWTAIIIIFEIYVLPKIKIKRKNETH